MKALLKAGFKRRASEPNSDFLTRHEEYFQRRPWEKPPRKLEERELANIVDHIDEPYYFEKRVVHAKLRREYGEQVEKHIWERANAFPNMAEGRRWAEHAINKWKREAVPEDGYDWDERDARLLTTANYSSGRPSLNRSFSLTIESAHWVVRFIGTLLLVLGVAFVIWKGYQFKKAMDVIATSATSKIEYYSSPESE